MTFFVFPVFVFDSSNTYTPFHFFWFSFSGKKEVWLEQYIYTVSIPDQGTRNLVVLLLVWVEEEGSQDKKTLFFPWKRKAKKRSESQSEIVINLFRMRFYFLNFFWVHKFFFVNLKHTYKTHSTAAASRGGEWLELEGRAKSLRQPEARHSPH